MGPAVPNAARAGDTLSHSSGTHVQHCWALPSAHLAVSLPSHPCPLSSSALPKLSALLCFALQRSSRGSLRSANSPFLLPFFTFPVCALKGKLKKSKFNWGAASQFLLIPVPGKHRAAVGPCPQEHAQGPQTQHCQLQVTKELLMPYNVCVLFTPLIVSEDLATFPTPMVIVVIISEFCPGHDAA